MNQKQLRRISRRREAAGRYLNLICAVVMALSLIVGRVQGIHFFVPGDGTARPAAEDGTQSAQPLSEEVTGEADGAEETPTAETEVETVLSPRPTPGKYNFTVSFMGDVNFDDSWATMKHLTEVGGSLSSVIEPDMLSLMNQSDLFSVNNEFAFTTRGAALEGKAYTFRANPENVSLYAEMGVDLVTLANNHIYDFGPEGLTDTLSTLDGAGVAHVGAGETLKQASTPYYVDIQNVRVAFVNACNAEVNRFTPEATATSSGVLLCYEHDKVLAATREARENADYVIAVVHWGRDYVYETSAEQRNLARELIDAGASVVVGGHSHSLQGIEYYNHCPIFYSLGSCWFNSKTLETYLLELHFTGSGADGTITPVLVPAMQDGSELRLASGTAEAQQVTDLLLEYSAGILFESFGDEAHLNHNIAVLREDTEAIDDWGSATAQTPTESATDADAETPTQTPTESETAA